MCLDCRWIDILTNVNFMDRIYSSIDGTVSLLADYPYPQKPCDQIGHFIESGRGLFAGISS